MYEGVAAAAGTGVAGAVPGPVSFETETPRARRISTIAEAALRAGSGERPLS